MSQFQYIYSFIVPALIITLPSDDNPENRATERLSFADGKFRPSAKTNLPILSANPQIYP
jgi:hypothetical protein